DGRMTDGQGRTVSFKNTILIMTSNLGSQLIMEMGEENRENMKQGIDEMLHRQFKPEFLNRIDEIIIFHSLSREDLASIVDIQTEILKKRLAEHKYSVELSEGAKEFLIQVGYDPAFGARPLKRAIQKHIQDALAMQILEGRFTEGDIIEIDEEGGELRFRRK
ncbi:AAA family ATPase, partial [Thermodesulfobacteriota bacterium]